MRQACEAGALRFLEARVLRSVPFEDEPPEQQELYAHAAHQLLMLFLDAQPGRCGLRAAACHGTYQAASCRPSSPRNLALQCNSRAAAQQCADLLVHPAPRDIGMLAFLLQVYV